MAPGINPGREAKALAEFVNLLGRLAFGILGIFHGLVGFFMVLLLVVNVVNRATLHSPLSLEGFVTILTALLVGGPLGVFLIVLGLGLFEARRWTLAPVVALYVALLLGQAAERFGPEWVYLGDLAALGWLPAVMPWVVFGAIVARDYGRGR